MMVEVQDLSRVLFSMFQEHGCNVTDELRDEIAQIEIVGAEEAEIIEALHELHNMIQRATRRH